MAKAREGTSWYRPAAEGLAGGVRLERPPRAAELVAHDSAMRAKGEIRRFVRANRCSHLGTLTFAEPTYDYAAVAQAVDQLLRRLDDDGWELPLVLVPEPHPLGHGWHVHFATDRFIPIARLRRWWGRGIVDIRSRKETRRIKGGLFGIASYLAKYVTKGLGADELAGCSPRPAGAHRYWRTQGFDPVAEERSFASYDEMMAYVNDVMGGPPNRVLPFGTDDPVRPTGVWLSWPDNLGEPPPGR